MKSIATIVAAAAATLLSSTSAFAVGCLPADPTCVNTVPEPGSLALVALAIAGAVVVARKKK